MNLYLYGYGRDGAREWLIVDMGITFGGETEPGIDVILPDIRFIEEEKHNIVGLLLTHAHEDHFGAVVDLWPQLAGIPGLRHALHRRDAQVEAGRDGTGQRLSPRDHSARASAHDRPIRRRADHHVALDSRAIGGGDPHAAWRGAAYRRLEARREPAHQRAHRRGTAQGARRGRTIGADLRFDQCRARWHLRIGSRRRRDSRPPDPRGAAAGGRHHLRLECRAHPLGGECRARGRPRARRGRPRHVPCHRGRAGHRLSRPRPLLP